MASWISFDSADKPEKLTTLDYHNSRYETIVTKPVISRHEALLAAIFDLFPLPPLTRMCIVPALRDGIDRHFDSVGPCHAKFARSKDEAEKIHMIWRYVYSALHRSDGSRCYALSRMKQCFMGPLGPLHEQGARVTSAADSSPSSSPDRNVVVLNSPSPEPTSKPSCRALQRNISLQSVSSEASAEHISPWVPPPTRKHAPPQSPPPSREPAEPMTQTPLARKQGRSPLAESLEKGPRPAAAGPKFVVLPPKHVACTPGRIRMMSTPTVAPPMKAMKGLGRKNKKGKKGKSAKEKASVVKASGKASEKASVKASEKPASVKAAGRGASKSASATTKRKSTSEMPIRKAAGGGASSGGLSPPMGFDTEPMDFTKESHCKWANDVLKSRNLLENVPQVTDPDHGAVRIRKQDVKSRPGNKLIQVLCAGKVWGQCTEASYAEEGVMFAASVLQFVAGQGYSKEAWLSVKQKLLKKFNPAD